MKSLLILLLLFSSLLYAESIDERKTDIYFANGVGATSKYASFNQGKTQIFAYIAATPSTQAYIGKYDLSFNTGHGVIPDLFEAWLQYTDDNPSAYFGWEAFKTALGRATGIGGGAVNIAEKVTRYYESKDILKQVTAYEKSIKLGHGVLVLAHSQGNFFTNKAYSSIQGITPWMKNYFITVGLASPSDKKIPHSNYLTYNNDPIHILNGAGTIVTNPNKYYYWVGDYTDNTSTISCLEVVVPSGTIPTCNEPGSYHEGDSIKFHAFNYYMQTSLTRDKVYNFLTSAIDNHKIAKSQWKFKKQAQCSILGCKDKLREVEHKYDTSLDFLMDGALVYPFKEDGKLYKVQDS